MAEIILLPIFNSIFAGIVTGIINRFIIRSECCHTQYVEREHENIVVNEEDDDVSSITSINSMSMQITDNSN